MTSLALAAGPMISAQADTPAAPLVNADAAGAVAGNYIVVLDAGSPLSSVDAVAALAVDAGGTVSHTYRTALKGFAATLPAGALDAVRGASDVAYVEQDTRAYLDVQGPSGEVEPNATWGIDRTDQRDLPLNQKYKYRHTGAGVSVYVIDTGVNFTHNEFEGRAISGRDTYDNDDDSTDCNGHGTHVSGTVAGATYGVAQEATIVGVRSISCGGFGDASQTIAAIDWVTANNEGRGVINMSLQFPPSEAMNDALEVAYNAGIPAAVAAANFSQDACLNSPAQEPTAVTVGATTSSDVQAGFSNYGPCVDLYAPGVDVTSAWIGSNDATAVLSGTSMASPHTAGALAKLLHRSPDATAEDVTTRIVLRTSKDKLSGLGPDSPNKLLFSRKF